MSCYFSGTDLKELYDNTKAYNYYLSLIVNFQDIDKWCAKIAFEGKYKEDYSKVISFKNDKGVLTDFKEEKKEEEDYFFNYNCKIEKSKQSIQVEDEFSKRFEDIQKLKSKSNIFSYNHNKVQNDLFSHTEGGFPDYTKKVPKIEKQYKIVNQAYIENILKKSLIKNLDDEKSEIVSLLNEKQCDELIDKLGSKVYLFVSVFKECISLISKDELNLFVKNFLDALEENVYEEVLDSNISVFQARYLRTEINKKLDLVNTVIENPEDYLQLNYCEQTLGIVSK